MLFSMGPTMPYLTWGINPTCPYSTRSWSTLQYANPIPFLHKLNEKFRDSKFLELLLTFQLQLQGSPHPLSD